MAKRERVTAGEFVRAFDRWRALAHRAPVTVTSYGRDDLVLLAADEYERLSRYEQRAFHTAELPTDVVNELGTVAPAEEAHSFDHEYPQ